MAKTTVVIVHLRRPRRSNPKEMRSDPFWEYGSFGLTGCHRKNLMNPKKFQELNGIRLAFAQGGKLGVKLVYLSPPIRIVRHVACCEATWQEIKMPFKYSAAPLLIDMNGHTDLPALKEFLKRTDRSGWLGRFSSRFRSRRRSLEEKLAEELVRVYETKRKHASASKLARVYVDALPYPPPHVDGDRESTYSKLIEKARDRNIRICRPRRKRAC